MSHLRIRKLKDEVRKNGFDYKLIKRDDEKCIYAQYNDGLIIAYEIFKTKNSKPHPKSLEDIKNYDFVETFPTDEEFGVRAWTYPTLDKALLAFDSK